MPVTKIKHNNEWVTIGTNVVNNLTSTSTTYALSANQGKVLNETIEDLIDIKSDTYTFTRKAIEDTTTRGQASIKSIHGNTIVWNQLANPITSSFSGVTVTKNSDGSVSITGTATTTSYALALFTTPIISGHKYIKISNYVKGSPSANGHVGCYNSSALIMSSVNDEIATATGSDSAVGFWFKIVSGVTYDVKLYVKIHDLTQMFGSGNEPSTVEEFKALYSLDYYAYESGKLLSFNGTGIKTNGFNQLDSDGHIKVLANQTYRIEGTYTSLVDSEGNAVTVSNSEFTPTEDDTYTMVGGSCVHLKHSGLRNGDTEEYWESTLSLPISTYFPNGMRSAGSVYDELTPSKAVTRIGVVDLGTLTWAREDRSTPITQRFYAHISSMQSGTTIYTNLVCSKYVASKEPIEQGRYDKTIACFSGKVYVSDSNSSYTDATAFKSAMSGVYLFYELATPTEVTINPPLELNYAVDDYGTEELLPTNDDEPTTSPIIAQINYGLDTAAIIREVNNINNALDDSSGDTLYGFHIDSSNSDPSGAVTYLKDAVGMTPAYMDYTNDEFNWGTWGDAFFIPKPCMIKSNGTFDYYLDEDDYTKKEDGTASDIANTSYDGNAMMQWGQNGKKIWLKVVPGRNDSTSCSVYIADHKVDNTYYAWSFINSLGNMVDHFYTPIYNGSSISGKLRSLSGQTVVQNQTAATEISLSRANYPSENPIWNIDTYCDVLLINYLLILMGKSLNTQAVFGVGNMSGYDSSAANYGMLTTGSMNTKGMFWGKNASSTSDNSGVKVFGMENWWANQWRRTAGLMLVAGDVKTKLCYGTADGSTVTDYNTGGSGYVSNGTGATSNGWANTMEYDEKGIMYPMTVGGSSSTYYSDYYYQDQSGTRFALRGGGCSDGSACGAFCWVLNGTASYATWALGASPSCKPLS